MLFRVFRVFRGSYLWILKNDPRIPRNTRKVMVNLSLMSVSSRRILLVDPDPNSGEALRRLIDSWGYDTTLAENGSDETELIVKNDPAVIIHSESLQLNRRGAPVCHGLLHAQQWATDNHLRVHVTTRVLRYTRPG